MSSGNVLVAQLDRVTGYEPVGRGFESLSAHHEKAIAFCNRFFSYIRLTARGITVQ